jgi:outer membrane murein-binding lipoprotein Lpp
MDHRFVAVCAAVALSSLLSGCGSDKDKIEKRLTEMREEITRLQNSQDRVGERLMAIEVQQAAVKNQPKAKAGTPEDANVERPPLKVIKLAPDGSATEAGEPAEPADDKADRPTIKLRGKEGALLDRPEDARVAQLRQSW